MNTPTLIGSLVFAAVVVVSIALVFALMWRGWRRRAAGQLPMIGELPSVPAELGTPTMAPIRGLYVGSTLAPSWLDRITVGDLGFRAPAVLTRYPQGILLARDGATPLWMPAAAILAVRTERGLAGKAMTHDGILAIRWRLPSNTEIDTGFRADDRREYPRWLDEENDTMSAAVKRRRTR